MLIAGKIMSGPFANFQAVAGQSAAPPPPSPKRVRVKLNTLADIRMQMATVYRECRSGITEISDGSRLINMLSLLGRTIESQEIEARLEALEARD